MKTKAVVPAAQKTELSSALVLQASSFSFWLEKRTLETGADRTRAAAAARAVAILEDALERERDAIVKPIKEGLKRVSKNANRVLDPLIEIEKHLRAIIERYDDRVRELEVKAAEREAKKAERRGEEQFAADLRTAALEKPLAPAGSPLTYRAQKHLRITARAAFFELMAKGSPDLPPELWQEVGDAMIELAESKLLSYFRAGFTAPWAEIVEERVSVVSKKLG
jgi:hypothetical protein